MKKKDICLLAIMALIIIIGVIIILTLGLNKELRFKDSQKIDIYVGEEIELNKIKSIANEVLGSKNMVQIIEIYGDMVTIRANSISSEQKDSIVNKVKEIYEFDQTAEETEIENVPATRIRDLFKKYILPAVISELIILVYMTIKYNKKGIFTVILNTILVPVVFELVLISILAITRIPIGIYTPSLILIVFLCAITYVVNKMEKQQNAKV